MSVPTHIEESAMSTTLKSHQGSFLTPAFEHATVADAMRHGVMTCAPRTPLLDVARTMAENHVHCVLVPPDSMAIAAHRGWRLVTDADLVRAARDGLDDRVAADAAPADPVAVAPDLPLAQAARLMDEHRIAHLLVVADRQPLGVISTLDVAGVLAWGRG